MADWVQNILHDDVRALLIAAVVSLGLLVFLFLILGLRSKRRERRENRAIFQAEKKLAEEEASKKSHALGLMDAQIGTPDLTPGMMSDISDGGMAETMLAPPPRIKKLSPKKLSGEAKLLKNIRRLEKQGDSIELAKLYSERGALALTDEDGPVAQEYFLKGLSIASLVNAPEQQAVARANLGDISHADGDLSTACEHWQLARDLYHACGEMDLAAEVETKMTDNQCPTDWVLNGF